MSTEEKNFGGTLGEGEASKKNEDQPVESAGQTNTNSYEATRKRGEYIAQKIKEQALKEGMKQQAFALANSNAMDGYAPSTHLENVNTWYDNALNAVKIIGAILTILCLFAYFKAGKAKK